MLEQTNSAHPESHPMLAIEPPDAESTRLSVPAPRASSIAAPSAARSSDRLNEMVARAELLLLHLESRLQEERGASDRLARATSEIEERLKLGVRMLQAIDIQVERGESVAARASELVAQSDAQSLHAARAAESAVSTFIDGFVRERFEWLERELAWRFDRVKEVEQRIEQAANGKLAWLDSELGRRLEGLDQACARAESGVERAEAVLAEMHGAESLVARAERAAASLSAAVESGSREGALLAQRGLEAAALRESLGVAAHEVAASRESLAGELRRMRDDLFWLTDRGERISSELSERADSAAACVKALRAQTETAQPLARELEGLVPLLEGENADRLRPVADAIAGRVRDSLAADMRGFTLGLRQLAERADRAFETVAVDPALVVETDPRSIARSFATELSRLGLSGTSPRATSPAPEAARANPVISSNQPLELEA